MTTVPTVPEHRLTRLVLAAVAAEIEAADPGDVDPDATFIDLGLDSTSIAVVAGDLSDELGREVPAETLFDFPTPARLAHHLAGSPG